MQDMAPVCLPLSLRHHKDTKVKPKVKCKMPRPMRRSMFLVAFCGQKLLLLWVHGHGCFSTIATRLWREVVREDCQALKLNTEDAMDRSKWRKLIKNVR